MLRESERTEEIYQIKPNRVKNEVNCDRRGIITHNACNLGLHLVRSSGVTDRIGKEPGQEVQEGCPVTVAEVDNLGQAYLDCAVEEIDDHLRDTDFVSRAANDRNLASGVRRSSFQGEVIIGKFGTLTGKML